MSVHFLKKILCKIPGVQKSYRFIRATLRINPFNVFLQHVPPGHYYSPIPDLKYIKKNRQTIFTPGITRVPGIDMDIGHQIHMIKEFAAFTPEMPFNTKTQTSLRYYFGNVFFNYGSAVVLYALMRYFRPKQIIEIGSGFSSAVMLDVNDLFFDQNINLIFVDPFPERLMTLMTDKDKKKHTVIDQIVQRCPTEMFERLSENDILFIDSSHVAKTGSDVVFILTYILPLVRKGVIIHFHDIFWPFEYPENWVLSGKAWNEAYVIKSFLQFNNAFKIELFNSYLAIHQPDLMKQHLPLFMKDPGSSLYIKKVI